MIPDWWAVRDLNTRPSGCKPDALTAELTAHRFLLLCVQQTTRLHIFRQIGFWRALIRRYGRWWAGGPAAKTGEELGCHTRRGYVWGSWSCCFQFLFVRCV